MEHERGAAKTSAGEIPCRCAPRGDDGRGAQGAAGCARCRGLAEGPVGDRGPSGDAAEGFGQHADADDVPKPPQNSISDPNATGITTRARAREGDDVPEAPDDDPALTGPLGLRNDARADEAFLKGVIEKLAEVEDE